MKTNWKMTQAYVILSLSFLSFSFGADVSLKQGQRQCDITEAVTNFKGRGLQVESCGLNCNNKSGLKDLFFVHKPDDGKTPCTINGCLALNNGTRKVSICSEYGINVGKGGCFKGMEEVVLSGQDKGSINLESFKGRRMQRNLNPIRIVVQDFKNVNPNKKGLPTNCTGWFGRKYKAVTIDYFFEKISTINGSQPKNNKIRQEGEWGWFFWGLKESLIPDEVEKQDINFPNLASVSNPASVSARIVNPEVPYLPGGNQSVPRDDNGRNNGSMPEVSLQKSSKKFYAEPEHMHNEDQKNDLYWYSNRGKISEIDALESTAYATTTEVGASKPSAGLTYDYFGIDVPVDYISKDEFISEPTYSKLPSREDNIFFWDIDQLTREDIPEENLRAMKSIAEN